MKRKILTVLFILFTATALRSQEFYFRPHMRYHTPLTYQQAPEYFNAAMVVNTNTGMYYTYILTRQKKFSLAKGISYGGDVGFSINKNIALEFGFDYFQNKEKFASDSIYPYYPLGTTAWQYRSLNAMPGIAITHYAGKVGFTARAGFIIGLSSLGKSIIFEDKRKTFMFKNSLAFGYGLAMEINYPVYKNISISASAGFENVFYKPRKAILKQDDFSYWDLGELPPYLSKIKYVKKIDHEPVYYDHLNDTYYTNYYKPLMRLKESLKLNSFYAGVNLIYYLPVHEKN
jgi:hypothetical protein